MTPRTESMTVTKSSLRIGIATVPKQYLYPDSDSQTLQRALLDKKSKTKRPIFCTVKNWFTGA